MATHVGSPMYGGKMKVIAGEYRPNGTILISTKNPRLWYKLIKSSKAMDRIKSAAFYPWRQFLRLYQIYLDKTVPRGRLRWLAAAILASIFTLRVIYLRGFYLVSFCLGIYVSFMLLMFTTPHVNDDMESILPVTTGLDEFKPYLGRYTEFQLWHAMTKAYTISLMLTFFSIFDLPFFWPVAFFYSFPFLGLIYERITDMTKHKYVPFTTGKMTTEYVATANKLLLMRSFGYLPIPSILIMYGFMATFEHMHVFSEIHGYFFQAILFSIASLGDMAVFDFAQEVVSNMPTVKLNMSRKKDKQRT
ncbi:Retrieval of early ER protein Rer1 [Artemisia annua]|uniref:Retrieval of early ER protein Rer1 n=1 Tax=Artemisia annua TaxID=35608 RepID=A0A2U1QC52_ARTAN|nr:Retrieval of early ER protein Rer1 [Artemisia annua]